MEDVTDGERVIAAVRPEEFVQDEQGLPCKVLSSTFLGRYSNHFLHFSDSLVLPDQPSLEYSQDQGQSTVLVKPGDLLRLMPNAEKINVFSADGKRSLMKGVRQYA